MRARVSGIAYAFPVINSDGEVVTMSKRSAMDPLSPVLRHVEEELQENVAKVCGNQDVAAETTLELEKLSDTLSAAARQAKAAAGLRRRMNSNNTGSKVNQRLSTPPDSQKVKGETPPQSGVA